MKRTKKTSTKKRVRTAKDNFVSMAYRIESLPRPIKKYRFLQTLIDFLEGKIDSLPRGWNVTWIWRNSPKQDTREDSFENTISNSRPSFMSLMLRRLQRDLGVQNVPKNRKVKRRKHTRRKKTRNKNRRRLSKMRKRNTSNKRRKRKH